MQSIFQLTIRKKGIEKWTMSNNLKLVYTSLEDEWAHLLIWKAVKTIRYRQNPFLICPDHYTILTHGQFWLALMKYAIQKYTIMTNYFSWYFSLKFPSFVIFVNTFQEEHNFQMKTKDICMRYFAKGSIFSCPMRFA